MIADKILPVTQLPHLKSLVIQTVFLATVLTPTVSSAFTLPNWFFKSSLFTIAATNGSPGNSSSSGVFTGGMAGFGAINGSAGGNSGSSRVSGDNAPNGGGSGRPVNGVGGVGGNGVVITNMATVTIDNGASSLGGQGGTGGSTIGSGASINNTGRAGNGGIGLLFQAGSSVINSGTI